MFDPGPAADLPRRRRHAQLHQGGSAPRHQPADRQPARAQARAVGEAAAGRARHPGCAAHRQRGRDGRVRPHHPRRPRRGRPATSAVRRCAAGCGSARRTTWRSRTLPRILRHFRQQHPQINLELTVDQSAPLHRKLKAGHLDLIFIKQNPGHDRGHGRRDRRAGLGGPGEDGASTRMSPVPLIAYQGPSLSRQIAIDALEAAGRTWRITCNTREVNGVLAAVRAGIGVAVFPRSLIPTDLIKVTNRFGLPELGHVDFTLLSNPSRRARAGGGADRPRSSRRSASRRTSADRETRPKPSAFGHHVGRPGRAAARRRPSSARAAASATSGKISTDSIPAPTRAVAVPVCRSCSVEHRCSVTATMIGSPVAAEQRQGAAGRATSNRAAPTNDPGMPRTTAAARGRSAAGGARAGRRAAPSGRTRCPC